MYSTLLLNIHFEVVSTECLRWISKLLPLLDPSRRTNLWVLQHRLAPEIAFVSMLVRQAHAPLSSYPSPHTSTLTVTPRRHHHLTYSLRGGSSSVFVHCSSIDPEVEQKMAARTYVIVLRPENGTTAERKFLTKGLLEENAF